MYTYVYNIKVKSSIANKVIFRANLFGEVLKHESNRKTFTI